MLDNKQHNIDDFDCGVEVLDTYLKERAGQEIRKKIAAVYVIHKKNSSQVIGYYTLSSCSVGLINLPENVKKKLLRYKALPVLLVGRLAVDTSFQGKRIGEHLLLDALSRSYSLSSYIGSFAVIVDAKNEEAKKFYEKYGFAALVNQPPRLYLSMRTIKNLVDNE